ncbi:MAG: hypothetical protein Q8K55_00370 [Gemmatimonadaceae bacterium]|nr:hypothetical protein [Gemmatimonadaceae bacterium]
MPYPIDGADPHGASRIARGGATWRRRDPRGVIARLSSAQRRSIIGLLAVVMVGYCFATRERVTPVGVAVPTLVAAPMSPDEAASTLQAVNETSQLEVRDGELTVRLASAAFPPTREDQLTLAQQYARADEIVEGRKRAINFLDPDGNRFARSDPEKGVAMTR